MNLNNKIRQCRREDFDTIFLVANSSQERQIIPLLRFYYADDVSIYVTSAIYSPRVIIDYDLDGVIFDDMPWVLAPEQSPLSLQQTQERIRTLWPNSYNQNYLASMHWGLDAYQILPKLSKMASISQYTIPMAPPASYIYCLIRKFIASSYGEK
ncbi:penicillin-binding protein activator [Candidatus Coxiella mudrowiae]|uniref:penicillin-binding protein activator n=1 Tax=Candidatus Coxiella mudrowiae TaxID=2054173 RepID=UPI0027D2D3F8|nr:penicillin-binding protein activator [Candidatus Coxiella mudrowiae]